MKRSLIAILMILFIMETAFSSIAVRMYTRQEGINESNTSKPRIYIQNIGTEAVSNFYYYYYFKVENGMTPVLETHYAPNCAVAFENKGNGLYAAKFTYNSISLQPGQILPNKDGNIIGLHYSTWSQFAKEDDPSFIPSDTFILNQNIPVYNSSDSLISGNYYPQPVPVPPKVDASFGSYAVLSKSYTDIRDRVQIKNGFVGSSQYVEAGCDAVLGGSIISGGNVVLRERANITGDVSLSGTLTKQNSIIIGGTVRQNAETYFPEVSCRIVSYGSNDITVGNDSTYSLAPGSYKDFHAFSRSTIIIWPGDYTFKTFITEPDVKIVFIHGDGIKTSIEVNDNIRIADRDTMSFESGDPQPLSVRIFSAQTSPLYIGTDAVIYGMISSPMAELHVYSRTQVFGILYGDRVVIEPEAVVCKPPVLIDLWHSEWAFGPAFDPLQLDYTAVVPDATVSVIVKPETLAGIDVKVNGNSGDSTVYLNGSNTKVPIEVSSQNNCGITLYNFLFTKASKYMIYVNDDSPCIAGSEDGNSWATAYKDLQQAINRALGDGKEIWLAEGTYKPTQRTESTDPRSATFLVYSGIEIKGGFLASETEDVPKGSPYDTKLTGDINGNDDSITAWPPTGSSLTYITDNVYHVVTITGNNKSSAVHLTGFVVEHGVANGAGVNANGGGIYIKNCNPTFEQVGIRNNIASSSGAGVYVNSGIKSIVNCLFKDNYSTTGKGAGLCMNENGNVLIDASIFDGNVTKDTSSLQGGSALYTNGSQIDILNSIFTRDSSSSINGTIFNNTGKLEITNCTFAYNVSSCGVTGIKNGTGSAATIVNTILWNSNNQNELSGSGFTVSYSCITKGYPGIGNIAATNPYFSNPLKPEGEDQKYGTNDDGLCLQNISYCIHFGTITTSPENDILGFARNTNEKNDIGAYCYSINNDGILGKCNGNCEFEPKLNFDVVDYVGNSTDIITAMTMGYTHVIQVELPKNKYTDNKNSITVQVVGIDINGNTIGTTLSIELYRVQTSQKFRSYICSSNGTIGKLIVFVKDMDGLHAGGGEHLLAYLIRASETGKIKISLNKGQF